jgi:hypothetical protein
MTKPAPNPAATYAALITIAESIRAGLALPPGSIDMWSQNRTAAELLTAADEIGAKVKIHLPNADFSHGHASISYSFPVAPGGAYITLYTTSSDISEQALAQYAAHNAECLIDQEAK